MSTENVKILSSKYYVDSNMLYSIAVFAFSYIVERMLPKAVAKL